MNTNKAIANLAKMKLSELQAKFAEVIGEKTRSHNKTFLIRKITKALQTVSDGSDEMVTNPGASTATEPVDVVSTATATIAVAENLTKLDVPQLQARYLEVVGRSTSSSVDGHAFPHLSGPNTSALSWPRVSAIFRPRPQRGRRC